jgi:hypothetical protein
LRGFTIYEGPSLLLPRVPIIVVATLESVNDKTGNMVQTWILLRDVHPVVAIQRGEDTAICGTCIHRGPHENGKARSCYVDVGKAPANVWRAWHRGIYPALDPAHWPDLSQREVRMGAYGDPAAVPFHLWRILADQAAGHTGYTHHPDHEPRLSTLVMGSADSPTEAQNLQALGWRTFRVRHAGDPILDGEVGCPASDEAGKLTQCDSCILCNGNARNRPNRAPVKSVTLQVHGKGWRAFV